MYYVVETTNKGKRECCIIPSNWMIHERGICYWPPGSGTQSAVQNKKVPNPKTWMLYAAKVLKAVDTYNDALHWLAVAEVQSDLNSESDDQSTPKRARISQPRRVVPVNRFASRDTPSGDDSDNDQVEGSSGLTLPPAPTGIIVDDHRQTHVLSVVGDVDHEEVVQLSMSNPPSSSNASGSINLNRKGLFEQGRNIESPLSSPQGVSSVNASGDGSIELVLLKKIAEDVGVIKRTVSNLDQRLTNLEKNLRENHVGNSSQRARNLILIAPKNTVEDFKEFEAGLNDDNINRLKLEMQECGGDSLVEFVGRVLRKLMTDHLARKYSLWGHKENENFSVTNCWKTLKSAALSIQKLSADERSIEKAGMNWFRHAGDRLKAKSQLQSTQNNLM